MTALFDLSVMYNLLVNCEALAVRQCYQTPEYRPESCTSVRCSLHLHVQ